MLINYSGKKARPTLIQLTSMKLPSQIKMILITIIVTVTAVSTSAQVRFQDITSDAGIQHQFIVYEGMFGGGACAFDLNNDGFEDVFITGGMADDVLYLNKGNGTFQNIFDGSGLTDTRNFVTQGVASADVNKDGWVDLYITTITTKDSSQVIPRAKNLLFLNNGNATFRNATREFGLDDLISFSTGASFGDFNADGYPDLYVGNYFFGYEGTLSAINDATIVNASQTTKGYLLQNIGGKYFENVYTDYNLKHKGFGFGAVFTDFNNDSNQDLLINHDFGYKASPNLLLVNEYPDKTFTDVSREKDMNLGINAMGTAIGDYNNDGWFDYYVTNIRFNRFMVSQGEDKPFIDKAKDLGLGYVSISWGANLADFDHDTDLDLFVANGDLNPNDVPMADYYFENTANTFKEIAPKTGVNDYGVGRGSIVFDMDNDGDLDLLVVNQKPLLDYPVKSETRLYRNELSGGNWIKIALKGITSEAHGIGSRVTVIAGGKKMMREIDGGSSHLSQNSTIAHFGLGSATTVDSVIVTWVGGKKQILTLVNANALVTIEEQPGKNKLSILWVLFAVSLFGAIVFFSTRKYNLQSDTPNGL